ncbi:uncharacterized protein LOC114871017 [Osmia bicornis bicornis]|uniref:uncharacterized protein LOC114871017 n=1 Tax=Osmia bicornis bicornis TaxID=1437191 RepID=UPI001EAF61A0|nr:uncharacterized protein LOC114871017 [Osmia bicornis bicornis]
MMKELLMMHKWLYFIIILSRYKVLATMDVNLDELKYLAARLNPFECRRLIAALHYTTYELPNTLAAAERNVDDEIPCIRHLLHWNSSPAEGKGKTHEAIAHRLRQINRSDLADWLSKSAFMQLGKDLGRAVVKAFDELSKEETEPSHPVTLEPIKTYREEEDPWVQIDTVLMAILLGLLGTLLTLICATIFKKIRDHLRKNKYKKLAQKETQNKEEKMEEKRIKYVTESSSGITDNVHPDSETETDFN